MTRYVKTARVAAALLWEGVVVAQQPPQVVPTRPQLLHPVFQDHAVLQRDRPIRVYGETAPRADVGSHSHQALDIFTQRSPICDFEFRI